MNLSVGEGIGKTLTHLCNLIMDSHMVKVTSCLAYEHSEYGEGS